MPSLSLKEILDRLIIVAPYSIIFDNIGIFKMVVDTVMKIFRKGCNHYAYPRTDTSIRVPVLWYEILVRIYAVGGLIVRKERWNYLNHLVLSGPREIGMEAIKNWMRHATTEIARAGLLYEFDENGGQVGKKN